MCVCVYVSNRFLNHATSSRTTNLLYERVNKSGKVGDQSINNRIFFERDLQTNSKKV